jgi:hypothetical protein
MRHRQPGITLAFLIGGMLLASGALAADMPKRKAGLWEIRSQMNNMPGMPPVQMCIDQNTDNLMQQQSRDKADCDAPDIRKTPASTTVHTTCRTEGSAMTLDAVYTGSFDSSYKADMKMHYAPPLHGLSDTHMVQEAKWLGACKAGQKPGDVVMHHGSFNVQEMMNDPRMQDMMHRAQQNQ